MNPREGKDGDEPKGDRPVVEACGLNYWSSVKRSRRLKPPEKTGEEEKRALTRCAQRGVLTRFDSGFFCEGDARAIAGGWSIDIQNSIVRDGCFAEPPHNLTVSAQSVEFSSGRYQFHGLKNDHL